MKVSAMNSWRLVFAATVLTGCTAEVGSTSGSGAATGKGSGATGSGATGSGGTSAAGGSGTGGSGASTTGGTVGTGGTSGSVGSGGTGAGMAGPCTPSVAVTSQIPRLTNAEYDTTVSYLLGVNTLTAMGNSIPSNLLATDQNGGLTDVGWAAYNTVGEAIATQVMADPALKAKFIS